MKKRITSLFLALALCAGLTVPALADTTTWTETGLAINPALRPYYLWANEMSSDWDDEAARNCLEEEGAEQLDFWRGQITIDTLRSTGYCLITSVYEYSENTGGKGIATVCYCDAPARLTLLCDAMKLNYGGVSARSLDADGRIHENGSLEPTYEAPCRWESDRGAGTYWDLPEGFYQLDIMAGTAVYFVVGSPAHITLPDAANVSVSAFRDVKKADWFYDSVNWAVDAGITNGTGNNAFSPARTCTQGEILTFLWRAAGSPEPASGNAYSNSAITANQYYYKALQWAWQKGVVDNAALNPAALCQRSDVVTYLWKLDGSPRTGSSSFTDVPANADYAKAVAWAVDAGITTGSSATTFSPAVTCDRGQIVTFLYRYFA